MSRKNIAQRVRPYNNQHMIEGLTTTPRHHEVTCSRHGIAEKVLN